MALISARFAGLRQTRPHEYALRFLFGGVCTALAGWIANRYGAEVGGLFLAFPAICPASATLIAAHEKARKARAGLDGTRRGGEAAALDAIGACIAAVALAGFAAIVWFGLRRFSGWLVMPTATAAWAAAAGILWLGWKRRHRRTRGHVLPHASHALRRP